MRSLFFITLLSIACIEGVAQSDCMSLAKTDLEQIFCRVVATPEAGSLPSFSDFRRNSAQIQALLLKRPAERLGITIPSTRQQRKNAVKTPKISTANSASIAKLEQPLAQPAPSESIRAPEYGLANCQFAGEEIRCPDYVYRLTHNRQNHQLQAGALEASNTIALPNFRGDLSDTVAVNRYLANCYQHYINKMLLIGLGGSTMSYTKFHYTFWELVEKREDFADRVGAMYNFLKKDKASMAVKTRYDRQLPGGIDWCTDLSDEIVVCDNGRKNWVYERK